MKIGVILMASGESKRFKGNKLLHEINGKKMIFYTFDSLEKIKARCKIVVVSRFNEIKEKTLENGFIYVENNNPEFGQSHSYHLGMKKLLDCDGIMFLVGDQPFISGELLNSLLDAFVNNNHKIIGPSFNGNMKNPCIFPKKYYRELFQVTGDKGGKTVIKNHLDNIYLVEAEEKELLDFDSVNKLNSFLES